MTVPLIPSLSRDWRNSNPGLVRQAHHEREKVIVGIADANAVDSQCRFVAKLQSDDYYHFMSVSLEEVRRIASLARLSLDDEEAARISIELSKILDFAVSIQKLDTSGIPPTTHVLDIVDVWRDDAVGVMLDRETVLASAPAAENGCFIAPKIV